MRLSQRSRLVKFWLGAALALFWCCLSAGPAFPQEVLKSQGICFRLVPGGEFLLGSPADEAGRYANELLPYQVKLPPFYLSETEITNAQYGRFLKATGHPLPLYWRDRQLNAPGQPVVGVSWEEAVAFTQWLTQVTGAPHRLPYEAEWEAAARGGLVGQPYPWGGAAPDAQRIYRANYYPNDYDTDGFRFTAPVGSFPANGYGLFDMAGNVAEWCLDRLSPQGTGTPFGPREKRVLKGGSWFSRARDLRCAARQLASPQTADGFIGFRVLRVTTPTHNPL